MCITCIEDRRVRSVWREHRVRAGRYSIEGEAHVGNDVELVGHVSPINLFLGGRALHPEAPRCYLRPRVIAPCLCSPVDPVAAAEAAGGGAARPAAAATDWEKAADKSGSLVIRVERAAVHGNEELGVSTQEAKLGEHLHGVHGTAGVG